MKLKAKILEILERLGVSLAIINEIMKGGGSMKYTLLALNVIDGLNKLSDFKNKKLRKLVEKEIIRLGYAELLEKEDTK